MHGMGVGPVGAAFHRPQTSHLRTHPTPFWQQPWYQQQQRARAGGAWAAGRNARRREARPATTGDALGNALLIAIGTGLFLWIALPRILSLLWGFHPA